MRFKYVIFKYRGKLFIPVIIPTHSQVELKDCEPYSAGFFTLNPNPGGTIVILEEGSESIKLNPSPFDKDLITGVFMGMGTSYFLCMNYKEEEKKKEFIVPMRKVLATLRGEKIINPSPVKNSDQYHMRQIMDIAKVCHEANKAFCESEMDNTQVSWDKAPSWQGESAINGVIYRIDNPDTEPSDQLPEFQKKKDKLFQAIVDALK